MTATRPGQPTPLPRPAPIGRPGPFGDGPVAGLVPGVAVAVAGAAAAFVAGGLLPIVSAPILAVAIGLVIGRIGLVDHRTAPGLAFSAKRLLRIGVVLLGLRLSFADLGMIGVDGLLVVAATVAATLVGVQLIGRRLGLSSELSLLVATGYAICGVSAIAAVRDGTDADDEEVAAAMGLVTLYGSAAMLSLPILAAVIGLDDNQFGLLSGASVHDVAQVVATAAAVGPSVVTVAVAVKLSRVALLVPVVIAVNVRKARRARHTAGAGDDGAAAGGILAAARKALPLFVVGFLAMVVVRSTGLVPGEVLGVAREVERWLLTAALVGLGAGIDLDRLRRLGLRPVAFGLLAWILVAGVALVGVGVTA
ncbi:MAG: putative sulfate exporter family transporter [Actinomycetota bacterium]